MIASLFPIIIIIIIIIVNVVKLFLKYREKKQMLIVIDYNTLNALLSTRSTFLLSEWSIHSLDRLN